MGKCSILDVSSVQLLSCVQCFATQWTTALQASLSITNSQSLLKLLSIESVMPSNHLILCHFLLLPPSIFPSIRIFSKESVLKKERKKEKLVLVHPRNDLLKDAGGPHCLPSRSHHASVSVGLVQLSLHFCECMVLSAPVCLA